MPKLFSDKEFENMSQDLPNCVSEEPLWKHLAIWEAVAVPLSLRVPGTPGRLLLIGGAAVGAFATRLRGGLFCMGENLEKHREESKSLPPLTIDDVLNPKK